MAGRVITEREMGSEERFTITVDTVTQDGAEAAVKRLAYLREHTNEATGALLATYENAKTATAGFTSMKARSDEALYEAMSHAWEMVKGIKQASSKDHNGETPYKNSVAEVFNGLLAERGWLGRLTGSTELQLMWLLFGESVDELSNNSRKSTMSRRATALKYLQRTRPELGGRGFTREEVVQFLRQHGVAGVVELEAALRAKAPTPEEVREKVFNDAVERIANDAPLASAEMPDFNAVPPSAFFTALGRRQGNQVHILRIIAKEEKASDILPHVIAAGYRLQANPFSSLAISLVFAGLVRNPRLRETTRRQVQFGNKGGIGQLIATVTNMKAARYVLRCTMPTIPEFADGVTYGWDEGFDEKEPMSRALASSFFQHGASRVKMTDEDGVRIVSFGDQAQARLTPTRRPIVFRPANWQFDFPLRPDDLGMMKAFKVEALKERRPGAKKPVVVPTSTRLFFRDGSMGMSVTRNDGLGDLDVEAIFGKQRFKLEPPMANTSYTVDNGYIQSVIRSFQRGKLTDFYVRGVPDRLLGFTAAREEYAAELFIAEPASAAAAKAA